MRSFWIAVVGLLICAAHNGPTEAYQPRAVFARASSQSSSILDVSAKPTNAPTGNSNTASNSRQTSADATTALSAAGSSSKNAPSATATQSSSALPSGGISTSTKASSSSDIITATPSSTLAAPAANATSNAHLNGLPITPAITPALSVAGAFMIITGVLYTLIGIKTKWLHTFLSATYLVSLAVTVLIVYVMHPPVTNAVQGAFFVAAFGTGLLFGGGALIFADLTEGLACSLGGFCLSMWFLELKPDGLMRSTIGKAVFIVCFTLGAYALYVSHYTRPYGLIGSISFAGATVIVLGIDCFSRAGLKEFWLYIWNINDAILPPHYSGPYPITRGIRVEIAATVLLFLIGVMSQIKVWKLVKKHRDQKAAARADEEQCHSQAELDIGRELEKGNKQERATWEVAYGGQGRDKAHQADSGLGTGTTATPRKSSMSVHEADDVEVDGKKSASGSKNEAQQPPSVTVRVASEDSIYEMPSATVENLLSAGTEYEARSTTGSPIDTLTKMQEGASPITSTSEIGDPLTDTQFDALSSPPIVPLPFTISYEDTRQMDDSSSMATFAASDRSPSRLSKRFSRSSLVRKFPMKLGRRSAAKTTAEGESMISSDDGQASSVAATFDIGDGLRSERGTPETERQTPPLETADEHQSSEPLISVDSLPLTFENLKYGHTQPLGALADIQSSAEKIDDGCPTANDDGNRTSAHGSSVAEPQSGLASASQKGLDANSVAASETPRVHAASTSFHDQLPEGASKVVMTYRTNEWAKHLGQADAPPPESLQKPSKGSGLIPTMTEGAAPVNVPQLIQTPLTAEPSPIRINTNLYRSASSSRDLLPSQRHHHSPVPQKSSLRRSSQGKPVSRTPSPTSLQHPRASRRSSTPLTNTPLVDSPIEEDVETSFPQRGSRTPSGMANNTLIDQRNRKLQTRYSTTSVARTSSSSSLGPEYAPTARVSDDPNLAYRRSHLQQQQSGPSRSKLAPRTSASYTPYHTDNGPTTPVENQETIVSAWRTSLRNDASADRLSQQKMEARRNELLSQKRRASAGAQAEGAERTRRESQRSGVMRTGDLIDRHREAMRKMQAGVEL